MSRVPVFTFRRRFHDSNDRPYEKTAAAADALGYRGAEGVLPGRGRAAGGVVRGMGAAEQVSATGDRGGALPGAGQQVVRGRQQRAGLIGPDTEQVCLQAGTHHRAGAAPGLTGTGNNHFRLFARRADAPQSTGGYSI